MLKNSSDAIRQSNEIAVIGVGCVLPGAHSVEEFRQRLASQEDLTTAIPADRWDVSVDSGVLPPESLRGGFLEGYSFNWKKHRIPPFQVANSNPLQFLLLDAADQAMIDSGYAEMPLDRSRVGTLVGAVFTNDFCADVHLGVRIPEFRQTLSKTLAAAGVDPETARQLGEEYQADFLKQRPGVLDETGAYSSSTLASRVAKQLDFCGGAITIDAGDGSSLAALASGVQLLRSQECSLVMCCGGQRNQDLVRFLQLQRDGRLKSEQNPDGILPGEGAVALLLKRREDAERDGDRIRAILTTVDSAADARRIGRSHLESRASAGSASRVPATILVRTGDRRTNAAVEKRDGASASRFGELSPRLGHLQGGAAMVEILAAILDSESTEGYSIAVEAAVQSGFVSPEGGAIWRSEFRSPGSVSNSNAEAGREDEMDVAGNVFDVAVDWTGCPEELLRVESRIEGDLQLTGLRRQAFVTEAADRCGRPRTLVENGHLERNYTLGDLIDRLSTPTTGEAMPVSESSITN